MSLQSSPPKVSLQVSHQATRAEVQAISFLMQQGVENPDCISLAAGLVDERTLPVDLTRKAVDRVLGPDGAGRAALQYGTTPGPEPIRQVFRGWLAEQEQRDDGLRNLPTSQLVLTTGSQQLLTLVTQAVINPGDICLVAAPTYFVYLSVLEGAGARIVPVASDEQGMCPNDLERQLQSIADNDELHKVKLVYVVSYYDNPSGSVSAPNDDHSSSIPSSAGPAAIGFCCLKTPRIANSGTPARWIAVSVPMTRLVSS